MMRGAAAFAFFVAVALAGCAGGAGPPSTPPAGPQGAAPPIPLEAGQWNGTALTMRASGIGQAVVRSVSFTSAAEQTCESSFRTQGNVTGPWAIGWAMALGPGRTYFSHELIREGAVNAQVAGTPAPATEAAAPRPGSGSSESTITVGAGERRSYLFAASYPPAAPGLRGGELEFEVRCPSGMDGLETGWSRVAHLLSDVSLDGTWASVHVEGTARWGAQPQAQWSLELPSAPTTFVSTEPLAGRATLTTAERPYACGPSADPSAAQGRALCFHAFGGGQATLDVSESAIGQAGQSGTSDSWMALVAQMESFAWPAGWAGSGLG